MSREERRRHLLEAAIKALAKRGVARAGHADVAQIAGVSIPTVFFYFKTREILVDEVLADIERFLFSVMDAGLHRERTPREIVRQIFRIFIACVDSEPDRVRVWLDWSTAVRESIWHKYLAVQERIIARFREMIISGQASGDIAPEVDSDDASHLLVGQAHMLVLMRLAKGEAERVSHFIDHLVETAIPRGLTRGLPPSAGEG
jgi:TetR/AcrR family hemagglutinin/protease transcriptional regulator